MSRLVNERYTLLEVIGQGSMGTVWRGHDELLDRDVAVKELLLDPDLNDAERAELAELAMNEARSTARLSHPGIITVFDVVEENGVPLIVMELVHGRSLAEILKSDVRLAPRRVGEIGAAMLDALREAHEAGIVHRDLKPANVLISERRVIITDFGIAQRSGHQSSAAPGDMTGTPAFMAPEQAEGAPAGAAADLWSLGATLYNAVEGRPPYNGPDYVSVLLTLLTQDPEPPRAAGPLKPLLTALLQRDPARRATADRAATLLTQALATPPSPRPGPTASGTSYPRGGSSPSTSGSGTSPGATSSGGPGSGTGRTAGAAHPATGGISTGSGRTTTGAGHPASGGGGTAAGPGHAASGGGGGGYGRPSRGRYVAPSGTTAGGGSGTGPRATSPLQQGYRVPGGRPTPYHRQTQRAYQGTNGSSARVIGRAVAFVIPIALFALLVYSAASSHSDPMPISSNDLPTWAGTGFAHPDGQQGQFTAAAVSPDGRLAAFDLLGGSIHLYDLVGHREIRKFAPDVATHVLAFSPDGSKLAAGADTLSDPVVVFDVATGTLDPGSGDTVDYSVRELRFSQDGKTLRALGDDGRLNTWDLTANWAGAEVGTAPWGSCTTAALSPDGGKVACLNEASTKITIWDTRTSRELGTLSGPGAYDDTARLTFSPDGTMLAIAQQNLLVWDVRTRKVIDANSAGTTGTPHTLVFSPDGKTLVGAGADRTDLIWRLDDRRHLTYVASVPPSSSTTSQPGDDGTTAPEVIAITPDSKTLVSGGGGFIRLIDLSSAREGVAWRI